jgi:hypothetical protein
VAEWINLTERTPEPGQAVLVKADDWRIPRVLEFDGRLDHPRLIDRMSGRFFWYPERMHWMPLPPPPKENQ